MDVLVFAQDLETACNLCGSLDAVGFGSDPATDIAGAQGSFLERGGHALLVIAPDVSTGTARELVETLRSVDADLTVIVFGEATLRGAAVPHLHRIKSFHPDSRAGIGAIQKVACTLSQT